MKQYKTYELSSEERQKMLDDAIIVLDTCAICSLYNLTEYYRSTMIQILEHLKTRIWLPRQVLYEYDKNRHKAINNPKTEKYKEPCFIKDSFVKEARAEIDRWKSNEYWHPFIDVGLLEKLEQAVEDANTSIRYVKDTVKNQYQKRRDEIDAIADNDLLERFVHSLEVEDELSINYLKEIAAEGDKRYSINFPPGYMDKDKPDEGDPFRKYGDLIIWKSIISQAQKTSKDIIFVSDDLKDDWVLDGKPRPELVSEFLEESGQKVDIYSLPDFIEALKTHYIGKEDGWPLFGELESVLDALIRLEKEKLDDNGYIKLKCDECGESFKLYPDELWMEWESEGDYDRGMGIERGWYCEEHVQCPYCDSSIDIEFTADEYPEGILNDFAIDCSGAKKIGVHRIAKFHPVISDYYSECERCGESSDYIQDGLCPACRYQREKILRED